MMPAQIKDQLRKIGFVRAARRNFTVLQEFRARSLREFRRRLRIVANHTEYRARRAWAQALAPDACLDLPLLQSQGFSPIPCPLPGLDELIALARERQRQPRPPHVGSRAVFSRLLHDEDFSPQSIFVRFALNERVVRTVAKYMGVAPYLTHLDLLESNPGTGSPSDSQLWHTDRTDRAVVKLVVYVSDVTSAHGPLCAYPRGESRQVPVLHAHYVPDDQLASYVDRSRMVPLLGASGSTFLVDTHNCLHMGSRCQSQRLAYFAFYETGFGTDRVWAIDESRHQALSEGQRLLLTIGATAHARAG